MLAKNVQNWENNKKEFTKLFGKLYLERRHERFVDKLHGDSSILQVFVLVVLNIFIRELDEYAF